MTAARCRLVRPGRCGHEQLRVVPSVAAVARRLGTGISRLAGKKGWVFRLRWTHRRCKEAAGDGLGAAVASTERGSAMGRPRLSGSVTVAPRRGDAAGVAAVRGEERRDSERG